MHQAGEMSAQLNALAALAMDMGSIPTTYREVILGNKKNMLWPL